MRRAALVFLVSCSVLAIALPPTAMAGDVPLTQPAPAWVSKAPLDTAAAGKEDAPELLILDTQSRIENGRLWTYTDRTVRVTSAEALNQLATLTLPWSPDKGDLIIHDVTILRDGKEINLLEGGKGFTVLRREESLEQLEYTGVLTATMPAEGLRTGDVLRLRYSVTLLDKALDGRVQTNVQIPAAPLTIGFARTRVEWDAKTAVHVQMKGEGLAGKPVRVGDFLRLELTGLLPKQPERPQDAPTRYRMPPLLEASSFADWADVSRVMAPLYATEGTITPGSPLAVELEKVKAAPTPRERAQAALRLVQDDVRYFAVGMDGGNYVPQKPADTWTKRYGDCKAKTLLLLALLRGSGIEAEPVLASSQLGDGVPERLPAAAAFDHVLVHARVDGQDLWLDGTASGGRIEDIADTPTFAHVLPLRIGGAGLIDLPLRPVGRPHVAFSFDVDESTSLDLPSTFTAKAVLRAPFSSTLTLYAAKLDAKQRREMIRQFFSKTLDGGQFTDLTMAGDPASGTVTLSARGMTGTPWRWDDKRLRRNLSRMLTDLNFNPDRARTDWAGIPVTVPVPSAIRIDMTLHLPDHGKGFTLEGQADADALAAARHMTRHMTMADGVVTMSERTDILGGEIAAADIPAQRDKVEAVVAAQPRLVAPADTLRSWEITPAQSAKSPQLAAIESVYAAVIRDIEPGNATPYLGRASLRRGIGDHAGAIADFTSAIAIAPDADTYLGRADEYHRLGRLKEALADAQKARSLDPSSSDAVTSTALLLAESGDLAAGAALFDQKIALGGKTRDDYKLAKADMIGHYGDPLEALKLLDGLIADRPGKPTLLNARCWIKGTRSVMIEGALKDCTSAIELSSEDYGPLDSRALVWLRMGRYAEALADLDAVLQAAPGMAPSRFLRAIVREHMGQTGPAAQDLAIARRIDPSVDHTYALYGIAAGKGMAGSNTTGAPKS
jgi:tetratricopeptide (TPR) repeat protein/transglutaminase-like putative cysteine protease